MLLSRAAVRDLYLEPPFRTSSSDVGATTSNSEHNRVNPRGPGEIRTNEWFPEQLYTKTQWPHEVIFMKRCALITSLWKI